MLGTDDDERPEDPDDGGPDDGVAALAAAAEGDSVTADRLRGDEEYFPDCRPALHPGQQPHHLLLLTTGHATFYASNGGHGSGGHGGLSHDYTADDGGVVVLTDAELLTVVDGLVCEVPYGRMQGTVRSPDAVTVHGTGGVAYRFRVARSADTGEVTAAYDYLRRQVREHA